MTDRIVVLGKRSVRKSEVPHLMTFGAAIAARSKQLVTTRTEGVASIVATAYIAAGGTPLYMTKTNYEELVTTNPVIAFTDKSYQDQLDKTRPEWRTADWIVIHNPKATEEAAAFLIQYLDDLGTPIQASA